MVGLFYAVIVPLVLRYSARIQAELIYVNLINLPLFVNLSNPGEIGLTQTRSFFLQHPNGCRIGVWHILPSKYSQDKGVSGSDFSTRLADGSTIILYLHGNTGSRAKDHRVELYQYLRNKGYHVVTFDYRGYGDSDCTASEAGLMQDGVLVWNWMRSFAPTAKVYLWGHSLGSGAATYLAENLTAAGTEPTGLVLEAPFTSILDAAQNHPLAIPYWPIMRILFRPYVIDNFVEKHDSAERLKNIHCPMLIFHGRKDIIIPFHLGEEMYQIARATRRSQDEVVRFVDCGNTAHKNNLDSEAFKKAFDRFIMDTQ